MNTHTTRSEMAAEYNTWYQHMNRLTEDEPLTALDGVSHTILQVSHTMIQVCLTQTQVSSIHSYK